MLVAALALTCAGPALANHHHSAHHASKAAIPMPRPRPIGAPTVKTPPTVFDIVAEMPEEPATPPQPQPKEITMQSFLSQFSTAELVIFAIAALLLWHYVVTHGWPWVVAKVKSIFGTASDDLKKLVNAVPQMNDRLVALEKDVGTRLAALEQKVGIKPGA